MGCWWAVRARHESGAQADRWEASDAKGVAGGSASAERGPAAERAAERRVVRVVAGDRKGRAGPPGRREQACMVVGALEGVVAEARGHTGGEESRRAAAAEEEKKGKKGVTQPHPLTSHHTRAARLVCVHAFLFVPPFYTTARATPIPTSTAAAARRTPRGAAAGAPAWGSETQAANPRQVATPTRRQDRQSSLPGGGNGAAAPVPPPLATPPIITSSWRSSP